MRKGLAFLCVLIPLTVARAATTRPATTRPATARPGTAPAAESLDALLQPIREKHGLPGLVAATVEGDNVVAIGAAGLRRVGSPQRITAEDHVHLGSCTKAMTATMLARLVERKTLSWDSTIAQLFPESTNKIDPAFRTVTLEQLLQHRAGLPHDVPWLLLGKDKPTPEQRLNLIRTYLAAPPELTPGKFSYSNVGYAVAAAMAERATKRSWEQLIQAEVFKPLGMTTAGMGPPGTPDKVDQPWGHRIVGKLSVPVQGDNPPPLGPAGRVHCSIRDWAKFASLHLRGARGEETKYLSPDTFARLHRPAEGGDYALGWGVAERPWAGGTVLTHGGSNTLWYCVVWIAPKKNFAVLAATNIGGDEAAEGCDDACAAMIQRHLGRK